MAAGIDMSLDDIIKKSAAAAAAAAAHRRFRSRPYGPGPDRRFATRKPAVTTPYFIPQGRKLWEARMFPIPEMPEMVMDGGSESGTKLYISNLDYGVSNEDIKLLFSEEGELKRYSIHYDKSGRSKGTAEVVFTRKSDALTALKKYNNMRLDGKPLQIELVGAGLVSHAVMPLFQTSLLGSPNDVLDSGRARFGNSRVHNGIARGGLPRGYGEEKRHIGKVSFKDLDDDLKRYHRFPRGLGELKGHMGKVSVRDLDNDLERYHLEAMRINKENGK